MTTPVTPAALRLLSTPEGTGRTVLSPEHPRLQALRRGLLRPAHLFDDSRAYVAGVNDAFEAVADSPRKGRDADAETADADVPDHRSAAASTIRSVGRVSRP